MGKRIQYLNETERQNIINANLSLFLVGEENIYENNDYTKRNNYLIFSDTQPIEMQLQNQADNQLTIMEALADIYTALPTSTV